MTNIKQRKLLIMFFVCLSVNTYGQSAIDGFENWKDSLNLEYLSNWEIYPPIDSNHINLEKVNSLNEGQFAAKILSNIPHWEGNYPTYITKELPFTSNLINTTFTYKCEGEGKCILAVTQFNRDTNIETEKEIWQIEAGDTNTYSITIDSISTDNPAEIFKLIAFIAMPVMSDIGSFGVSVFTIDSLAIENVSINSNFDDSPQMSNIELYPNPTKNYVQIKQTNNNEYEILNFKIFDNEGKLIRSIEGSNQTILLPENTGVYYILITTKTGKHMKKILKI